MGYQDEVDEALSSSPSGCSPFSAALPRMRQLTSSCSNNSRHSSTELIPLTSSTAQCDENFCNHSGISSSNIKQTLINESSNVDTFHDRGGADLLGAPCTSNAVHGMDADIEQLLHNPSLQDCTWRTFGSVQVQPSPSRCLCAARIGGSGTDISEMLIHGSWVFTAHKDQYIRVWKLSSSNLPCKPKLLNTLPAARDHFLHFLCDHKNIRAHHHHLRRLWPIKHADNISALAIGSTCGTNNGEIDDADPELLYSASWDKTFKVWRLSDHKCMDSVAAHMDAVNAIATRSCSLATIHEQPLYTASCDGTVKAWTREVMSTSSRPLKNSTLQIQHRLIATLPNHKCAVNALAISRDGINLFSAGSDGRIRLWRRLGHNEAAHMSLCSILEGHKRAVLCLSIAADDRVLLSGSADKTVRAWCVDQRMLEAKVNCRDGEACALLTILKGHKAPIKSLYGLPCNCGSSNYTIYTGALDASIKVWRLDAKNGQS